MTFLCRSGCVILHQVFSYALSPYILDLPQCLHRVVAKVTKDRHARQWNFYKIRGSSPYVINASKSCTWSSIYVSESNFIASSVGERCMSNWYYSGGTQIIDQFGPATTISCRIDATSCSLTLRKGRLPIQTTHRARRGESSGWRWNPPILPLTTSQE